jgi:hypothetical protein
LRPHVVIDVGDMYVRESGDVMPYVRPGEVRSPKLHWSLIDVLIDGDEGGGAYALGIWDGERRIGFRWNGTADNPLGNPQSRGLPTWTMLGPELHEDIIRRLPPDKAALARSFLGIKLIFDGPSPTRQPQTLAIYDLTLMPPVIATIPCGAVRHLVQRFDLSDLECQLLVDRYKHVFSAVAAVKFEKGEFEIDQQGRIKRIPLTLEQLQPIANQLSTEILDVARLCQWARVS